MNTDEVIEKFIQQLDADHVRLKEIIRQRDYTNETSPEMMEIGRRREVVLKYVFGLKNIVSTAEKLQLK